MRAGKPIEFPRRLTQEGRGGGGRVEICARRWKEKGRRGRWSGTGEYTPQALGIPDTVVGSALAN